MINSNVTLFKSLAGINSLKAHTTTLSKSLSISVINQAVSSATNFLFALYLVRVLSPRDFGIYGIGMSICLFYTGVGNALFLTQMVVNSPDKPGEDRLSYAARVLVGVLLFSVSTLFLIGLTLLGSPLFPPWLAAKGQLVMAVGTSSVALLIKEYFVRQAYTANAESRALATNSTIALSVIGMLAYQHLSGWRLDVEGVLWIFAIGQVAGAVAAVMLAKLPLRNILWRAVVRDIQEAWVGGRWALGGVSVTWAQSQAYMYVIAFALGPVGVGFANAARLFIAPFTLMLTAINQVTMPRLAELRVHDRSRMIRYGLTITAGLLVLAVVYAFCAVTFAGVIAPAVLGDKYRNITPLVIVWCVALLFQLLRDGAGILMQVMKKFRALAIANAFSAIVSIVAALALIRWLGASGAILGTVIGDLCLGILLWRMIRNDER